MKRLAYILLPVMLLAVLFSCEKAADGNVVSVRGEIDNLNADSVLMYSFGVDSAWVVNCGVVRKAGSASTFEAAVQPDVAMPFVVVLSERLQIPVFARIGDEIIISGDIKQPNSINVAGGDEINDAINQWRTAGKPLNDFVRAHPNHVVSAWMIYYRSLTDKTNINELVKALAPNLQQLPFITEMQNALRADSSLAKFDFPYYSNSIHAVITESDGITHDSTYTAPQLKAVIDSLISR